MNINNALNYFFIIFMIFSSVLVIKFYADWQTVAYGDFATLLHIAPLQFRLELTVKCLLLVLKQAFNYLAMNKNYTRPLYQHSRML